MILVSSAKRNIGKTLKLFKRGLSSSQIEDQDVEYDFEENHCSSVSSPSYEMEQDINFGKENSEYTNGSSTTDIKARKISSARKR